ncbi:D-ribose-binding periplasmic protein precursor [Planctomycetes bacterium Pan216]|uniref:D-ribose-binding periplasmic protein n=1 Tax=Kolteria novifilia TaxID=2527975 RepID=A0A518BBA1_9BACT|nr:D-ribose-binding periplasmic protein precursor [Planctomycetes bacterium Pan216]
MNKTRSTLLLLLAGAFLVGCGDSGGGNSKPTVAYVTNGIASFWLIAEKGAEAAAKDSDVNVEVKMPPKGVADQKRMVQELLTAGVDGIAISPIDPANQGDLFKEISERTNLITQDSDAPESDRLCYIGMDNYKAGRMCGELVKEAMPEGGTVMLFVGRLGQLNARLRRQGVIDELLDRDEDPNRYDQPGSEIKGDKYTILGTQTDLFDFAKAKSLAEDSIAKYPDLGCMVGLFAYNPPKCLEAVKEAQKVGQIKVVGFDEDDETLQGIKDGSLYGSVVQNPYQYGYESVRVLAGLARGDQSVLPEGGFLDIPARKIKADTVDEFWANLKELTGESPKPADESKDESTKGESKDESSKGS